MFDNLINSFSEAVHRAFPAHSTANGGWLYIILCLIVSVVVIFLLTKLGSRQRRSVIVGVTFLAGLFYVLEFFVPVTVAADGKEQNVFTQFILISGGPS